MGEVREYLRRFGNVSLYDAGFRFPYYGSTQESAGQVDLTRFGGQFNA